jgi:Tfp pilus assembly protein PilF
MSFVDRDFTFVASQARQRLEFGDTSAAVELLRRFLSAEPEHAQAHALLAHALVGARRLHAAEFEAGLALTREPELVEAHVAMASVLVARRKWRQAEAHLETALALDPTSTAVLSTRAALYAQSGREAAALADLERALALEPDDADLLAQLAALHLARGDLDEAERAAREAMERQATPVAIEVLGYVALRRGDAEVARQQVAWLLNDYPAHQGALTLLASIKARESKLLGLWWRYNVWMQDLGNTRSILVLIGAFAVYRAGTILLEDTPNAVLVPAIQLAWLAAVAYSWAGPSLFRAMLDKELEKVSLRDF